MLSLNALEVYVIDGTLLENHSSHNLHPTFRQHSHSATICVLVGHTGLPFDLPVIHSRYDTKKCCDLARYSCEADRPRNPS